ncbi:hypothetical protein O7635_18845 [Asanoa sp. WMMD1127]|uniref:hypothetical protein n=1 Tax=Asanoa sp. WMMD1127 TaxID=3016107 RepID=UPI002417AEE8|nr:hypothetical protein [Asanoa sp. WMMD1127]MDG4823919.1 hypothetical protein [Asanoa sp. WMMD1127]
MSRRRALVLLTVLTVAGCSSAGTGNPPTSPPPPTSPAAPTSAQASPGVPTTIPVRAFFAVPEPMRAGEVRGHAEVEEALPRLCGDEFASAGETAAGAAVRSTYRRREDPAEGIPHGVLFQTIRTYPGDGAASFLTRLRADLTSCKTFRRDDVDFRVRTAPMPGVGDEALWIDLIQPQTDLPGNPIGGDQVNRVVVLRVGDTVSVLRDTEYERSSSIPAVVDEFARGVVTAIEDWRR